MPIHIHIEADSAEAAKAEMRTLLGVHVVEPGWMPAVKEETFKHVEVGNDLDGNGEYRKETGGGKVYSETESTDPAVGQDANPAARAAVRKRGEPSPGHKRRTKVEIAEDEAAHASQMATLEGAQTAAISTGESRVGPDDEPEVEQQDVADEAAETAKAGAELTHDDIRNALGKYVQKFGMDAAQRDGPKVFALALKDPAITKISLVPGDQKSLKLAVDGVNEMLAKNPFDRAAVA